METKVCNKCGEVIVGKAMKVNMSEYLYILSYVYLSVHISIFCLSISVSVSVVI